ncbi:hypothetical protein [Aeromicrobium alkaliterrae]|uniref:Uncharacterized protein n=1 Tax=Aeromicrobium alkaliterrae TaxID=302168 RepID=A0ABP4WBZ3_9ACTN
MTTVVDLWSELTSTCDPWETAVQERWRLHRKRGSAMAEEHTPPHGQAALWFADVLQSTSPSGRDVARQLARLCGDDSKVTIPHRSLSDAVGVRDSIGRQRAYTERGVEMLTNAGWLRVETVGLKRGARTTYYLMPGGE